MEKNTKFLYPLTEPTIHRYAESIFSAIKRGECATSIWVPMTGRRMWNKFIVENINLFEKELPYHQNYVLVYVEPLDLTEESLSGYLRLLANSFIDVCKQTPELSDKLEPGDIAIFQEQEVPYSKLLESLQSLLHDMTKSGKEVIFFLGEFDELNFTNRVFYNNLKSLWSQLYPRLHYIFLMRDKVTQREKILQWGELTEAILQNVLYVPICSGEDIDYLLGYFSEYYSVSFTPETGDVLKEICGGHPYMLKVASRVVANNGDSNFTKDELRELLLNYYELKSVAHAIFELRDESERSVIKKIAGGEALDKEDVEVVPFLKQLGIVISENGDLKLFGKAIAEAALESKHEGQRKEVGGILSYDVATGAILLSGRTIEEKFTHQEYSVLSEFVKNPDKVLNRDDIGAVLWGKESYEKYSDWAIDQLMSKLRKKLKNLGIKAAPVTLRGKGYKLANA